MPHRYTDVDRMILSRWTEVIGLREAFGELQDRIKAVLDETLTKVAAQAHERGFSSEHNAKEPYICFWKKEWETKTWKAAGISILIKDFAPFEYGKVRDEHPWMYLDIQEAGKLKIKDRTAFANTIRAGLTPALRAKWEVADVDIEDFPVGITSREITDADRVQWMSDPAALAQFLLARLDESREIIPAVDRAIEAMGR